MTAMGIVGIMHPSLLSPEMSCGPGYVDHGVSGAGSGQLHYYAVCGSGEVKYRVGEIFCRPHLFVQGKKLGGGKGSQVAKLRVAPSLLGDAGKNAPGGGEFSAKAPMAVVAGVMREVEAGERPLLGKGRTECRKHHSPDNLD